MAFDKVHELLVDMVFAVLGTPNTVAKRGTDGSIKAATPAGVGTSAAADKVVTYDAGGKVPAAALTTAPALSITSVTLGAGRKTVAPAQTSNNNPNSAIGNIIYSPAGGVGTPVSRKYDTTTDLWSTFATAPFTPGPHAPLSGVLYIAPDQGALFYYYNPANDTYTTVASMPSGLNYGVMAAHAGKIYRFGNASGGGYVYTPGTNTWATFNAPAGVNYIGWVGSANNKLWMTGSVSNGGEVFLYSWDGTAWTNHGTFSTPTMLFPFGTNLIALGTNSEPIRIFNTTTLSWSTIPLLVPFLMDNATGLVGNALYRVGPNNSGVIKWTVNTATAASLVIRGSIEAAPINHTTGLSDDQIAVESGQSWGLIGYANLGRATILG